MVLAFQPTLPSVSKLIAFSRGFSCDNLQVVFLPLFFSWRYMSSKFKGEITHKPNSSTKQNGRDQMVARELKGGWDLSTEILFVFLQEMEGEWASTFCRWLLSPRSSWEASVPEKQCTVEGINSLEKDAKWRVPGQGCLLRNNLVLSSTRIPWLQTANLAPCLFCDLG